MGEVQTVTVDDVRRDLAEVRLLPLSERMAAWLNDDSRVAGFVEYSASGGSVQLYAAKHGLSFAALMFLLNSPRLARLKRLISEARAQARLDAATELLIGREFIGEARARAIKANLDIAKMEEAERFSPKPSQTNVQINNNFGDLHGQMQEKRRLARLGVQVEPDGGVNVAAEFGF